MSIDKDIGSLFVGPGRERHKCPECGRGLQENHKMGCSYRLDAGVRLTVTDRDPAAKCMPAPPECKDCKSLRKDVVTLRAQVVEIKEQLDALIKWRDGQEWRRGPRTKGETP